MTINHDTENTICQLNLQIQNITTELEAIKMFVKEQRNKKFTELLQQQNKNLLEENKSKTTIIEMLIENQNLLNKVGLESNLTKKFEIVTRKSNKKQSVHKTDEIKCSNRYESLYIDDNYDESCKLYNNSFSSDGSTSSDKISDEISLGNMQKKKNRKISKKRNDMKRKDRKNVIKEKDETTKERTGNLHIHKNRYYHQSKAPVERIQSTFSSVITKKRKKIVLFSDSILKNLRMGEFNSFIKKRRSFPESVSGGKSKTIKSLNHTCWYKRLTGQRYINQ